MLESGIEKKMIMSDSFSSRLHMGKGIWVSFEPSSANKTASYVED